MTSESIRVLLVEDNLGDARLLYEGLEEALPGQFQMTHVRRLSEALDYLWKEPCDVVLLDLGLPDSHGLDTLVLTRAQRLSAHRRAHGLPGRRVGPSGTEGGGQDYLVKGQTDSSCWHAPCATPSRKAATEAMIGEGIALASAGELRHSRQRLIAAHERECRNIATLLRDDVQERIHTLNDHVQEFLKEINSPSEKTRLLSDEIDGLNEKIEKQVGFLCRQLHPSTLERGSHPGLSAPSRSVWSGTGD